MQITLTKEQVKEAFGELRFMGADNCYRYDKDSKKKTEEVEALKLHLGSMKLGNSVDIRLEATELPKIEPYAVVELEEPVSTDCYIYELHPDGFSALNSLRHIHPPK